MRAVSRFIQLAAFAALFAGYAYAQSTSELSGVRPVADWSEQEIIRTAVGQAESTEVAA